MSGAELSARFAIGPDEQLLAAGACTSAVGPLTVEGQVFLTTERICFEPTGLNRLLGAPVLALPLIELQDAHFEEAHASLVIVGGGHAHRLVGAGAREVYEVLAPLLDGIPSDAPRERVLLFADGEIAVNDLLSAVGEVTLTTWRLRFQLRGFERRIWPVLDVNVALTEVSGFRLCGIRRRLEVQCGDRVVRFLGPVVPSLYGALRAAAELTAGAVTLHTLEHEAWPVDLHRRPLSHPGALVRTATRLTFLATGTLDALIGLEPEIEMPLSAIERIALCGTFEDRIAVTTASGAAAGAATVVVNFSVANVRSRYDALVAWMADRATGPVWLGAEPPEADREAVAAILAPWRSSGPVTDSPRLFCPAVRISGSSGAEPGWLSVDDALLLWVPRLCEGSGAIAFRLPLRLPHLGQTYLLVAAPAHELHLQALGGARHRWRVASQPPQGAAGDAPPLRGGIAPHFRRALREHLDEIDAPESAPEVVFVAAPDSSQSGRRKTYRVPIPAGRAADILFWTRADDVLERLDCTLADWSLGGCGVLVVERLPPGTQLHVHVHVGTEVHPLLAEFVFDRKLKGEALWFTGLRFVGNWGDIERVTNALWQDFQHAATHRSRATGVRRSD